MSDAVRPLRILVYSDDRNTRARVMALLGPRPSAELPQVEYVECATEPAVIRRMDAGGIDLAILDGEAVPAGGMGICRQLKDEIYQCPPILLIVGRPADAWLATWSRADDVAPLPLDPLEFPEAVATLFAPPHRCTAHRLTPRGVQPNGQTVPIAPVRCARE
jgi:DNA-binding response OmpR family regulator